MFWLEASLIQVPELSCNDIMELPGFFYDEVKKKYFRITSGTPGSTFLTENDAHLRRQQTKALTTSTTENMDRDNNDDKRRKDQNIVQTLLFQETGTSLGQNMRCQLSRSRISNLKAKIRLKLDIPDFQGERQTSASCTELCVRPEDECLYGVWRCYSGTSVMARVPFKNIFGNNDPNQEDIHPEVLECFLPGSRIMGMDSVSNPETSFTLCLASRSVNFRQNSTSVSMQFRIRNSRGQIDDIRMDTSMKFEFPGVFYSCCAGSNRFAIGGDKHIKVFTSTSRGRNTIFDGFMSYSSYEASSTVTAIKLFGVEPALDPNGEVSGDSHLVCGTNKGSMHWFDLKNAKEVLRCRMFKKTISELKQLNDNQWIVSGHDHQLSLVDRRCMTYPVLSFQGHSNACRKFSVSIDNDLRVMCSPGDDCITRIWSVDTGKLLNEIPLPSDVIPCSSNFVRSAIFTSPANNYQSSSPCIVSVYGLNLIVYERDTY